MSITSLVKKLEKVSLLLQKEKVKDAKKSVDKMLEKAKEKAKKQKAGAKKRSSAYNKFVKKVMPQLMKKFPSKKVTELMPKAAEMWNKSEEKARADKKKAAEKK